MTGTLIRFLVIVVLAIIILPHILGLFGGAWALALVAIIVGSFFFKRIAPFVIAGLVLLFILVQAVRTAKTSGKDAAGQSRAGATALATELFTKVVEKLGLSHAGTVAGGFQGARDATDDLALAEHICLNTSFARSKFGDPAFTTYCQRQDAGIFVTVRTILGGGAKGTAGPVFQFLTDNTTPLETNQGYLDCLGLKSRAIPNIEDCYQKPFMESVHKWRLCTELALQLKDDDVLARAPLAPEILKCRNLVGG
jgi:hypothetical protein